MIQREYFIFIDLKKDTSRWKKNIFTVWGASIASPKKNIKHDNLVGVLSVIINKMKPRWATFKSMS